MVNEENIDAQKESGRSPGEGDPEAIEKVINEEKERIAGLKNYYTKKEADKLIRNKLATIKNFQGDKNNLVVYMERLYYKIKDIKNTEYFIILGEEVKSSPPLRISIQKEDNSQQEDKINLKTDKNILTLEEAVEREARGILTRTDFQGGKDNLLTNVYSRRLYYQFKDITYFILLGKEINAGPLAKISIAA